MPEFCQLCGHDPERDHLKLKHDFEVLQDEIAVLREALTPSADTKAAYRGEFSFGERCVDEGDVVVHVPWTTIKEIMAAILAYAEIAMETPNG